MKVTVPFRSGLGKMLGSPAFVFSLYLAGLASAIPLAFGMRGMLHRSFGDSLVQENLRAGFDMSWYGEFEHAGSGMAETFGPWIVGILAPLDNLERLMDGMLFQVDPVVLTAGLVYLFVWIFLAGGVIARYAGKEDSRSAARFFGYCGEYFFPFVRLMVLSVLVYLGLFRWAAPSLFRLVEDWTLDVTVERTVLLWTLAVYLVAGAVLVIMTCALDYAKIAMVVDRKRSAVLALLNGLRFVLSRPTATLGLYLMLLVVGLILLVLYAVSAPGPGQAGWTTLILAFAVSQTYLVARVALKLWFLASQTDLYHGLRTNDLSRV